MPLSRYWRFAQARTRDIEQAGSTKRQDCRFGRAQRAPQGRPPWMAAVNPVRRCPFLARIQKGTKDQSAPTGSGAIAQTGRIGDSTKRQDCRFGRAQRAAQRQPPGMAAVSPVQGCLYLAPIQRVTKDQSAPAGSGAVECTGRIGVRQNGRIAVLDARSAPRSGSRQGWRPSVPSRDACISRRSRESLKINPHRPGVVLSSARGRLGVDKTAGLPFWTRAARPAHRSTRSPRNLACHPGSSIIPGLHFQGFMASTGRPAATAFQIIDHAAKHP